MFRPLLYGRMLYMRSSSSAEGWSDPLAVGSGEAWTQTLVVDVGVVHIVGVDIWGSCFTHFSLFYYDRSKIFKLDWGYNIRNIKKHWSALEYLHTYSIASTHIRILPHLFDYFDTRPQLLHSS
jgi:hypothetical protein